jgi:catechol 2,3-dioxygenase-like lactoylglutathione lyase family enzyme
MKTTVGALTLFVADKKQSKEFYVRVFGTPVLFEIYRRLGRLVRERAGLHFDHERERGPSSSSSKITPIPGR